MTHAFVLYQRDDCHLCDQAVEVLAQVRAGDFASVFVDGDMALEARYGVRVPVLADAHGRELDWPFDAARLRAWLAAAPGGKNQRPAHGCAELP
ncbi:MAG: glutaredoxin family protein [Pseudomonas sp.]